MASRQSRSVEAEVLWERNDFPLGPASSAAGCVALSPPKALEEKSSGRQVRAPSAGCSSNSEHKILSAALDATRLSLEVPKLGRKKPTGLRESGMILLPRINTLQSNTRQTPRLVQQQKSILPQVHSSGEIFREPESNTVTRKPGWPGNEQGSK